MTFHAIYKFHCHKCGKQSEDYYSGDLAGSIESIIANEQWGPILATNGSKKLLCSKCKLQAIKGDE